MELAQHETTDAALLAGLRAIPMRRLSPVYGAWLACPAKRVWWVTWAALSIGNWSAVQIDPALAMRVVMLLGDVGDDIVLERVQRFVATGSVFSA